MKNILLALTTLFLINNISPASEKVHDHSKHEEHSNQEEQGGHEEHGDHEEHSDHEEHGDHEEDGDHEGHSGHGGGKALGEGKAITLVDKQKGFKLSEEAFKTLGLKLKNLEREDLVISKSTLVTTNDKKGIYRRRDGFFKFVETKSLSATNEGYRIKISSVRQGDQIVVDGLGLLRVADVYSTDDSEYAHAH